MASSDRSVADDEEQRSPSPAPANDAADLSDNIDQAHNSGAIDDDMDEDDLFGDGGDDDQSAPVRHLDDEDLDSGDDEGRPDRASGSQQQRQESEVVAEETYSFMDAEIVRHPVPEPSDGELYLLKVPHFLSFEPTAFDPKTFQPPQTDHHSRAAASEHFSAFDTALTTIRWRRAPNNPKQLQSNARLLRWSDGSLTLQLASQPLEQYEINANALAPPQINPKKPTPTSLLRKPAKMAKESYTYLAAPYEESQVMRVTNKITTGLQVVPSDKADTAVEVLQSALAKAANRQMDNKAQAISFIDVPEDPELARARKEQEYKQRLKQQRAKEKNEQRAREKESRVRGHRTGGFGLSTGMLEDEERDRRGGARKPRAKMGGGYASDDDYGRGRTKEDEYDEEDDFIAASDEEEEVEDDDDPDDGIVESPRRRASPKRQRARAASEDDDEEEVVVSRTKRRRVIDDDDEDE